MTRLSVATYNLELGGREQIEAIYTVLAHMQAAIVGLTEADDPQIVATLAERLGYHHVRAAGSGDRHIAMLSRFPIVDWHIYNQPPLTQAVLQVTVAVGNGRLTLYNIHFLPYLLLPYELHRWRAVGALLKLIRQQPPGLHLILGDLNAIGPGDKVLQHLNPPRMQRTMRWQLGLVFKLALPRLLRAGYSDCFRHLHPHEDGFTWYTREHRTTRYDYILADRVMIGRLLACRVVDEIEAIPQASDHFPLLAEFEMS
jgi:endonuclease/exonuclease/phosphatase family metal-dependent hydrolase